MISHTNVYVERVFSHMNFMKSDLKRNSNVNIMIVHYIKNLEKIGSKDAYKSCETAASTIKRNWLGNLRKY